LATLDDGGTCAGVCDHGSPYDLHLGHDFDDRIWFSSTGAEMIEQTLVQELQKTFERVAEIVRANDLGSGTSRRKFNFKSASLFVRHESAAQSFAQLTAAGLLVFLRPDKKPFIGIMGRIDFRRGGATELRALLARLQKGALPSLRDQQAA